MDRIQYLLKDINRETAYGIEVGPFYNPIAPKSQGWNTIVVDFTDQSALIETAQNHTVAAIREMVANIEMVDVVWRDVPLDEACLKLRPEGFDYLIASHVIEHIPDMISFLQQVSALARPGFILSLAVPDSRLTFDFFRPLSTVGQALDAYRAKPIVHTPQTLFEAHAYMIHRNGAGAWLRNAEGQLKLVVPLQEAYRKYIDYLSSWRSGRSVYIDAHCWIFTPSSFELMILELNELECIDFVVTHIALSVGSEFFAQLRKGRHGLEAASLQDRRLTLLEAARRELAEGVDYLRQTMS